MPEEVHKTVLSLTVKEPDDTDGSGELPEGTLRFVASTAAPDRENDTINQAGWVFAEGKIPFLWAHDRTAVPVPPLGTIVRRTIEQDKLILDVKFDLDDDFAAKVYRKYQEGFMDSVSVGFRGLEAEPNDQGGLHFQKQELLELSAVSVGAHPDARLVEMAQEAGERYTKAFRVKAGRVLSAENYRKLQEVVDIVQAELAKIEGILEKARAPDDEDQNDDEDTDEGETEDDQNDESEDKDQGDDEQKDQDPFLTILKTHETEDSDNSQESFLTTIAE